MEDKFVARDLADFADRARAEQRRTKYRAPQPASEVIAKVLKKRGYGRMLDGGEIQSVWSETVGLPWSQWARAGTLRRGVLTVYVASSGMLQEIKFQEQQILKQIQERLPQAKIERLRFQVGN